MYSFCYTGVGSFVLNKTESRRWEEVTFVRKVMTVRNVTSLGDFVSSLSEDDVLKFHVILGMNNS